MELVTARPEVARTTFKILVVSSDTFPPTRVDVTVLFGEELARRGHRIDWILQSEGACAQSFVTPWSGGRAWVGATDLGGSLLHRIRKHILGIAHDLKLFPILRHGDYDIIEVKDKFVSGVFAAIAARLFKKRFVYWLSYPFPEEYLIRAKDGTARYPLPYVIRGTVFKVLLYKILLPAADHVFVQSEQMRRDVAAEGIPASKLTAVPMGVRGDASVVQTGVRSLIPAGLPCFLYLGALGKLRRIDFLVRVLALVRREVPRVRLYVVGRGDHPGDEQLILDEAKRLDVLDSLVMIGQLPQPEALRYVREADVCVSPLYPTPVLNAGSPTKLVEYMAMEKAVVANDHPEQKLVIDESSAGFCVPYEEEAFARAIVALLNNPGLARQMGERGRQYVLQNRTYARIADTVQAEMLRVANGSTG